MGGGSGNGSGGSGMGFMGRTSSTRSCCRRSTQPRCQAWPRLLYRFFAGGPGGGVCGSRPKAPATLREAGVGRSGYRAPASFCAIDRLPDLCDVWHRRRPRRPDQWSRHSQSHRSWSQARLQRHVANLHLQHAKEVVEETGSRRASASSRSVSFACGMPSLDASQIPPGAHPLVGGLADVDEHDLLGLLVRHRPQQCGVDDAEDGRGGPVNGRRCSACSVASACS